jgi:type IV pilus assembly protein PilX
MAMMQSRHAEHGAALIVGLVLLMVLTVLAISAMRTATLDLTMAGNAQFHENAFQLAESGIQATYKTVMANPSILDNPVAVPNCPPPPVPPQQIWDAATLPWQPAVQVPALQGRYEIRICLEGTTQDMPGTSVGHQLHYRIESRGRTDQRNAEAIHAQGIFRQVEE